MCTVWKKAGNEDLNKSSGCNVRFAWGGKSVSRNHALDPFENPKEKAKSNLRSCAKFPLSHPLARLNQSIVCLARNSYSLPSSANEAFSLKPRRRLNAIIYEAIFQPYLVLPPFLPLTRCTICFPSTAKTAANACTCTRYVHDAQLPVRTELPKKVCKSC